MRRALHRVGALTIGISAALILFSTTAAAAAPRLITVSGVAKCMGFVPWQVPAVQACTSVTLTTSYAGGRYSRTVTPDAQIESLGNFTFTNVPAPPEYSFDSITFTVT